ncbi:hypothetical protein G3V89_23860 [Escherichia coli]|nr:hypothetical protein [Escherichia coli]
MERLTHERCNGIKTGYWSPERKKDLVRALAAYENTGLTPEEIIDLKERDTAMQVEEVHLDEYYCPACGAENNCNQGIVEDRFCPECGQKLKAEAYE